MSNEDRKYSDSELEFIDEFWGKPDEMIEHQPTSSLKSNFYQMLEQHQKPQKATNAMTQDTNTEISFWDRIASLVMPSNPALQFAMVAVVFIAGMGTQSVMTPDEKPALTALESQVEQLNSMVAISLLQQASAAERLSGVAYSRKGAGINKPLLDNLFVLLSNDKSSSVRLAIVDALGGYQGFEQIESRVLESLLNQDNVLVQMSLAELVLKSGSRQAILQLQSYAANQQLFEDVTDELNTYLTSSNI